MDGEYFPTALSAADYYEALKRFLLRLPRLAHLEIVEWDGSIPPAPALGSGLRKLVLRTNGEPEEPRSTTNVGADSFAQLADRCPGLEHLAVQIHRSQGDAAEVAIYRTLGRLPRLGHVSLNLDVSPPPWIAKPPETPGVPPTVDTVIERHFDDYDKEYEDVYRLDPYRKGHVRDILVNSAIDESLARAIFDAIDSARVIAGAGGRKGVLWGRGAARGGCAEAVPGQHGAAVAPLRRESRRDEHQRDATVRAVELDRSNRENRDSLNASPGHRLKASYVEIFRGVWPEKYPGSDWKDDWRS